MTPRARTPSSSMADAIVEAASRLLEDEGPGALTVRRIAAEAGVAPMGVYNHFGGKDGVIDELFTLGFDRLRDTFAEIPPGDPVEDLMEAGRRYRRLALAHPGMYSLMFDRVVPGYEPSPEAMAHAGASFERLVAMVQRAIDKGEVEPTDDPAELAQRIWSMSHGIVSLELRGVGFVADADAHHERAMRMIAAGLRASRA